ncbi:hypothetical protein Sjap_010140 [Stephania japonica]|uniref:CCG-binding protein 1 n=1 Tax=Stephania japonica TaxID=461633 RepID=A0AAP0P3Y5_9MAGN
MKQSLLSPREMLRSITTLPSSSSLFLETVDGPRSRSSWRAASSTICCSSSSSRNHGQIPKLEPFSRSKADRWLREPSLIEKTENDISDYCLALEGDDCYYCWRSYFELKNLERTCQKEDVERLILESGGMRSLMSCIHRMSEMLERTKREAELQKPMEDEEEEKEKPFPKPDGLPKSAEEIEEEEKARMADSAYTRLLRAKGRFPAWYSPLPDHETD